MRNTRSTRPPSSTSSSPSAISTGGHSEAFSLNSCNLPSSRSFKSSKNSLRVSSSMGVTSYHFSLSDFAKNAGLPKKRRKKAHGKKPRAFSIQSIAFTGSRENGSGNAAQPAPGVLGVCPPGYWDSRPRCSPPVNSSVQAVAFIRWFAYHASLLSHDYNTAIFPRCQGTE